MKKRNKIIFLVVSLAVLLIVFLIINASLKPKVTYTTATVAKVDLIQTVNETGTLKPLNELTLNFINQGKVGKVAVKVGDKVTIGQILAELDHTSFDLSKKNSQAQLTIASAGLEKLLRGATNEDLAISQANFNQAQSTYNSSRASYDKLRVSIDENIRQLTQTVFDLQSQSDVTTYQQNLDNRQANLIAAISAKVADANAALNAIDRIVNDPVKKLYLSQKNPIYLATTLNGFSDSKSYASQLAVDSAAIAADNSASNITAAYGTAAACLSKLAGTLNSFYTALLNTVIAYDYSQTTLDADKTIISNQSAAISADINSLLAAKQAWTDAQLAMTNALTNSSDSLKTAQLSRDQQLATSQAQVDSAARNLQLVQAQFNKAKAKARPEDISLAQAQVVQAQVAVASAQQQIDNSIIKSPINGVVTQVNYQIGEQVALTQPMLAVLSQNSYEIELDVAETDIAKIKLNDPAEITLDALGDQTKFFGTVFFIDPAQTVISGVTYYQVKVSFSPTDLSQIKPGMTASVTVTTANRSQVLAIPLRAVIDKNGTKLVRILNNDNTVTEIPVSLGLLGDSGLVEVTNILKEGDKVVTASK